MANARRRTAEGRVRKRESRDNGFIAPLPKDENWMEALLDDADDGAPAPRAGPVDHVSTADLTAVHDALEEQREVILLLAAKVEELEASLAVADRRRGPSVEPPPVPGPVGEPAPSSPGPPPPMPPPTVRDLVGALREQSMDVAARLGEEVAKRRRRYAGR